ncbi:MAG TPA: PEP-CTERM sorting domain-containing protein [Gammaproteobacteria bacterium]|nr:PEP-CTERM sorting domain-containing protein [Gammaproteobacteria bacterium]
MKTNLTQAVSVAAATVLVAALGFPARTSATTIDLGLAGQYAVFGLGSAVDVGTTNTAEANTANIYGNVAVGAQTTSPDASGYGFFQKGFIQGDLVVDGSNTPATYEIVNKNFTVTGTVFGTTPANPGPNPNSVGTGTFDLAPAVQDAIDRSVSYAVLSGTSLGDYAFGSGTHTLAAGIYSATSFDINSHTTFVINGSADDIFVMNVTGDFDFQKSYMQLTGGITSANVLFNVTGTGTAAKITGDESEFFGTLLATYRDIDIQGIGSGSGQGVGAGNAGLEGRVIGALSTDGTTRLLNIYSGAEINQPASVPEPTFLLLFSSGLVGLGLWGRRRGRG